LPTRLFFLKKEKKRKRIRIILGLSIINSKEKTFHAWKIPNWSLDQNSIYEMKNMKLKFISKTRTTSHLPWLTLILFSIRMLIADAVQRIEPSNNQVEKKTLAEQAVRN
jgi:hypothetical protein